MDYINTHGTSTPAGDIRELEAIREAFGERIPADQCHQIVDRSRPWARWVHEAIYPGC